MENVLMTIVASAGMIFSSKDCIWKFLCSFNELIVSWQKKYPFCLQKQNQVLKNANNSYNKIDHNNKQSCVYVHGIEMQNHLFSFLLNHSRAMSSSTSKTEFLNQLEQIVERILQNKGKVNEIKFFPIVYIKWNGKVQ